MNRKIALITGITGQDGSYLAELLLSMNYIVHGIKRRSSSLNTSRIDHLYQDPQVNERNLILHYGDLTDSGNLIRIIQSIQPDEIYNLGAQSHVQVSFESPEYTANADAIGAVRILEAIRLLGLQEKTRFYQASTSEMFGLTDEIALNEKSAFYPRSPYGAAKLYAYWMAVNYREAYNIFAANGILFNHESPRRGETFVTKKIVAGAVSASRDSNNVLVLGNLDAKRDWGHAKDFVDGMWRILQHGRPDDWVLATGESATVRFFVEKSYELVGLNISWSGSGVGEVGVDQNGNCRVTINERYFRPTEVPHLLGDSTKARNLLGWKPQYNLNSLIEEMVESELKNT